MISRRLAPLLLLGTVATLCAPMLIYPMGRDQAILGYAGWRYLHGAIPGLDSWDQKPPGAAYIYALAELIWGHGQSSVRWLDLLWSCATGLTLFALVRRWASPGIALAAGVLWAWDYGANFDYWNSAQVDGFLTLPAAASLLLAERGLTQGGRRWWLASGAVLGQAVVIKYTVVAMLLPIAAGLWMARATRGGLCMAVRDAALLGLGFAASLTPWVIGLALTGGLWPILETQRVMNAGYTALVLRDGLRAHPVILNGLLWFLATHAVQIALALPGAVLLWRRAPRAGAMATGWTLAAAASYGAQLKFYPYHSLPLLAPLAVLDAVTLAAAAGFVARRTPSLSPAFGRVLAGAVFAVLQLGAIGRWEANCANLLEVALTTKTREDRWRRIPPAFSSHLASNMALAETIRTHSREGDTLAIWGFEPLVNYLAERAAPTRFVVNVPLIIPWGRAAWREEFVAGLRRHRPTHIVICHHDAIPWTTGVRLDSAQLLPAFPAFDALLREDYIRFSSNALFTVLQRRDLATATPVRPAKP